MDGVGLFNKYKVLNNVGPTESNAQYFVLRLDTDPHARVAARAYAASVKEQNMQLATDLFELVAKYESQ